MSDDSELGSLVVKLEADLQTFQAQLLQGQQQLSQATQNMSQAISDFSSKSNTQMTLFQSIASTALGVFSGDAILDGVKKFGQTVEEVFKEVVSEGIASASQLEDEQVRLNLALAGAGKYSAEASDGLREYADELSNTTKFSDGSITATMASLEAFGQLDENGLKKATKAALDLSTTFGIDLTRATQLVGRAAEGNIQGWQRFGLTIVQGSTNAETFNRAVQAIEERTGGSAQKSLETFSGAIANNTNEFEKFTQAIGDVIIKNDTVIEVIHEVSAVFQELATYIKANEESLKEMVSNGIILAISGLQALNTVADLVARAGELAFNLWKLQVSGLATVILALVTGPIGALAIGLSALTGNIETMKKVTDAVLAPLKTSFGALKDSIAGVGDAVAKPTQASQQISKVLEQMQQAAAKGFAELRNGIEGITPPTNGARNAMLDLSAQMKQMIAYGEALSKSLVAYDPSSDYKKQVQKLEIEQANYTKSVAQRYNEQKKDLIESLKQQQDALAAAHDKGLISTDTYLQSEQKLQADSNVDLDALDEQRRQAVQKDIQQKFQWTSEFFGNMSSLSKTKNQELFEIGKAASLAQAVVDGVAAVQKTMASIPYPVNIPMAAAQATAAAVNVAQISAQTLATGIDQVPGIGSSDNFPAILAPGERVVPSETNKDLTQFLQTQGGVPQLLSNILKQLQKMNPQVQVQIGGKTITDAVRTEVRRGRAVFA